MRNATQKRAILLVNNLAHFCIDTPGGISYNRKLRMVHVFAEIGGHSIAPKTTSANAASAST